MFNKIFKKSNNEKAVEVKENIAEEKIVVEREVEEVAEKKPKIKQAKKAKNDVSHSSNHMASIPPFSFDALVSLVASKEKESLEFCAILNSIKMSLEKLRHSEISVDVLNKLQSTSFIFESSMLAFSKIPVEQSHRIKLLISEVSGVKPSDVVLDYPLQIRGFFELYFWNKIMPEATIRYGDLEHDYHNMTYSAPDKTYQKQHPLSPEEIERKLEKHSSCWLMNDELSRSEIKELLTALDRAIDNIQNIVMSKK